MKKFITKLSSIKISYFIVALFLLRLGISLALSDGTVKSDGITYLGLFVNLQKHHSITAVLPEDETWVKNHSSVSEIVSYLSSEELPQIRILHFQWLLAVAYYPIIAIAPSIYAIIAVNNFLLLAAGLLLFRLLQPAQKIIAWCILLLFPPFFYLTNNFFSEPLFILLLSVLWCSRKGSKIPSAALLLCAIALCLSRPIGSVYVALFSLFAIFDKQKKEAVVFVAAILIALTADTVLHKNFPPHKSIYKYPSVPEAIYLSNTPIGNGDIDYYLSIPEMQQRDSAYTASPHLMQELPLQIVHHPIRFIELSVNKLQQMFFNTVPDNWVYHGIAHQALYKKILWSILTLPLWIFTFLFVKRNKEYRYLTLLCLTFALHFIIIARFRYLLPVLTIALPYIAVEISERFKMQNGSV